MKPTFLTSTIVLLALAAFSQNPRGINWQQFTKTIKTTEMAKPVPVNEFVTFQIDDINKFLYKVEIAGSVFELQTPIPSELESLFRIKSEDRDKAASQQKSKEAVEKTAEALSPMAEVAQTAALKVKQNEGAITELRAMLNPNPKTAAQISANKSANTQIESAVTEKAAQSQLARVATKLVSECKQYLELAKTVSANVFALKNTKNKFVTIAQMDVSKATIAQMVNDVKWPIPNIEQTYTDLTDLYKSLELRYSELLAKAKAAKESDEVQASIQASLEAIEEANDLIEEDALLGLLNDVDFLFKELNNPNNFRVVAPPVQMDGDYVAYEVSIIPTPTSALAAHRNPVNFKFAIPTKGGLKVDFSVGPVISFGNCAKDEKYFLEETAPDMVTLRKRENNNWIVPGIAAMMHAYSRGSKVGGMFGIGAGFQSDNKIEANLFFGGSIILGKREKLMLSAGASILRVERLKDSEFVIDKEYNNTKIDLGNITEKVFKPSIFFSISYNLTNKVIIK